MGEQIWWLGIHEPGVGLPGWVALLDLATSAARCVVCRAESFPPKCPFDTRFLAPLAKVIHPAVHSAYRLSKVSVPLRQDVSPLLHLPLHHVSSPLPQHAPQRCPVSRSRHVPLNHHNGFLFCRILESPT
jgi:hypothetical protein